MAEYRKEKYYWFKLKDDFFKRHDIKIIKSMPNGKDYVIFYLQLLCESLSHEGKLRFNEEVPYDEEMLSIITDTNIDVVRSAMKLFCQLKLIEILDDQTIYMTRLQNMVGSTTIGAEKKMLQREKSNQLLGGGQKVDICPPEIDIEKDIEIDIEKDKYINNKEQTNIHTCVRELFEKVKAFISLSISSVGYSCYIEKLECVGIKEDKLVLSESSSLTKDAIDSAYRESFIEAIKKASNGVLKDYIWED